jgi:hypothetical protein
MANPLITNEQNPPKWISDVMEGREASFRNWSLYNGEAFKRNHIGGPNTYDHNGIPNNGWERSANKVADIKDQANQKANIQQDTAEANTTAPTPFSTRPGGF